MAMALTGCGFWRDSQGAIKDYPSLGELEAKGIEHVLSPGEERKQRRFGSLKCCRISGATTHSLSVSHRSETSNLVRPHRT